MMHESHYSAMLKETLVIFRIWLINKPHFHLLPKGERIAVILLIAHTAPYVWTLNSCKVGWKKQMQNETFLLFLSLSFKHKIFRELFSWLISLFHSTECKNQPMIIRLTYVFIVVLKVIRLFRDLRSWHKRQQHFLELKF